MTAIDAERGSLKDRVRVALTLLRAQLRPDTQFCFCHSDRKGDVCRQRSARFSKPVRKILIFVSNPEKRQLLRSWLEKLGVDLQEAPDLKHAVQMISQRSFAVVICDNRLKDGDGVQFLHWLRREVHDAIFAPRGGAPARPQAAMGFRFFGRANQSRNSLLGFGSLVDGEVEADPKLPESPSATLSPVARL
jgi:hypothetical protein